MISSILILLAVTTGTFLRFLTFSGAFGALVIGFSVSFGFGLHGLLLLGTFFGTSSLVSRVHMEQKSSASEKNAKSDQRDFSQVMANGLLPGLASIGYAFTNDPSYLLLFITFMAAANSDTWASELGTLSTERPFHMLKWKRVDPGTSGAVTLLGTVSALIGSLCITIVSYVLWQSLSFTTVLYLTLFGFAGNVLDTLLGASVQVSFRCKNCGLMTEKVTHCGQETVYAQGIMWINNETVNFLAILLSGLIALFTYQQGGLAL